MASSTAGHGSPPPTPVELRFSETILWITERIQCRAPAPPGLIMSSFRTTCRANAILTSGRKSKPWCGSDYYLQVPFQTLLRRPRPQSTRDLSSRFPLSSVPNEVRDPGACRLRQSRRHEQKPRSLASLGTTSPKRITWEAKYCREAASCPRTPQPQPARHWRGF